MSYVSSRGWRTVAAAMGLVLVVAGVGVPTAGAGPGGPPPAALEVDAEDTLVDPTGPAPNEFGAAVALNADGDVAVVGAPVDDNANGAGAGAAFVFERDGADWTAVATLLAPDGSADDAFGTAVAIDAAGDTAVIGAPGNDAGAAYVFSGPDWNAAAPATIPSPGDDDFGAAVAIDAAGDTALVGSPGSAASPGSAWLFQGPDWLGNPTIELSHPDGTNGDRFGAAVALDGTGTTALVGAPEDDTGGGNATGSVHRFEGPDFEAADATELTVAGAGADEGFGTAVALDGDGDVAVVGSPGTASDAGAVWLFEGSAPDAGDAVELETDADPGDLVGTSVAVTADGTTVVAGAPGTGNGDGVAWAFTGPEWNEEPADLVEPSDPSPGAAFGGAVAAGGGRIVFGARFAGDAGAAFLVIILPPPGGGGFIVRGTVYGNPDPDPPDGLETQSGSPVQLLTDTGAIVGFTTTDLDGEYEFLGVQAGDYVVQAHPPPNIESLLPGRSAPFDVPDPGGDPVVVVDVTLPKRLLAAGEALIEPNLGPVNGVPAVPVDQPLVISAQGCPDGTARYELRRVPDDPNQPPVASGALTESGAVPGRYGGVIPPLDASLSGEYLEVVIIIECPDGTTIEIRFTIYIDPSGFVRDLFGDPVVGATVTLLRSDSAGGPFTVVPDGSAIMSPLNRTNPDLTDDVGHFGWDVVAGFYKVQAEKTGCVSPSDPGETVVETAVLTIPPPVTDLDIRLDCGAPQPPRARDVDHSCPPLLVPEDGFTDLPPANVHEAAVDCIVWWGVARGFDATTYGPAVGVTRAQMASFIARLLLAADVSLPAGTNAFPDDDASVHHDAINQLAAAGVVQGRADGTYGPDVVLSRAQMATFLTRAAALALGAPLPAGLDAFTDDEASTHEAAINAAAEAGLAEGRRPGIFDPGAAITRDQMGSFLSRLLDLLVEEEVAELPL